MADLLAHLRQLRRDGQLAQAQALLARSLARNPGDATLVHLAWLHEPFWWQPLTAGRLQVRRRGPADAGLLRRCWADSGFMQRFNRLARPLPADDTELQALLHREHWALPDETHALHWTLVVDGEACGLASLVDWSWPHRRAEFLLGLLPGSPPGPWAARAAERLFGWLADQARMERLTACFYADNPVALDLALRLGFEREGCQRGQLRDAQGQRHDLVLAGLLLDGGFFQRRARLRRRLLGGAGA